jgi:hypothetical protein
MHPRQSLAHRGLPVGFEPQSARSTQFLYVAAERFV